MSTEPCSLVTTSRLVPSCSPEDQVPSCALPVLRQSDALTVKGMKIQAPLNLAQRPKLKVLWA